MAYNIEYVIIFLSVFSVVMYTWQKSCLKSFEKLTFWLAAQPMKLNEYPDYHPEMLLTIRCANRATQLMGKQKWLWDFTAGLIFFNTTYMVYILTGYIPKTMEISIAAAINLLYVVISIIMYRRLCEVKGACDGVHILVKAAIIQQEVLTTENDQDASKK